MTFHSILFSDSNIAAALDAAVVPDIFADLNLDQIVAAITVGRDEYHLAPFFHVPLRTEEQIRYRHEVMADLERPAVAEGIEAFAQHLRDMRAQLAQAGKLHYEYQRDSWFLDAAELYCDTVNKLCRDLYLAEPESGGLRGFADYLHHYTASDGFSSLLAETVRLKTDLAAVAYTIHIKGNRVSVDRYDQETDYSADVLRTFAKFRHSEGKSYRIKFPAYADMNHVEANILSLVAELFPEVFGRLRTYCEDHRDYLDRTIGAFDREIQFYLAYRDFIGRLTRVGLHFCYPAVSAESKEICAQGSFDLALANSLLDDRPGTKTALTSAVVCNDFYLTGDERILVVSGPNQGGKTTFARAFGQLHYLAALGGQIPGEEAHLFLPDRIFTHFEKEEDLRNLRGKLHDDLVRIHEILDQATVDSILILNEIFTSTTADDALFLDTKILEAAIELDLLCICVTFVDELSTLDPTTVSMVGTVDPDNPAVRTFKIERRPSDGLAYAAAIAEKYALSYTRLTERLAS